MSMGAKAAFDHRSCRRTGSYWRIRHTGIRATIGISAGTSMAWRSCRRPVSLAARSDGGFRVGSAQSSAGVPA